MRIDRPVVFVIASRRDAVFTGSPMAVYSSLRSEPTLPDISGPLLMPIPIRKRPP